LADRRRRSRKSRTQAAARDLLAPVYGWLAEEFDTAALKATRASLDELA